jgi:hypothetical protein
MGTPGFDNASGYGLLNIPSALNFRTPARDPQEPNEKPREIEAHALFPSATRPLTTPSRTAGSISAHVDRSEDPIDLYRVWAPAGRTLHAQVTGSVLVRLLERTTRARPLAVGKHGVATYRNEGKGLYVYAEVRPAVRFAEYKLRLTAVRR